MAKRRVTPEEDVERLTERLRNFSKGNISNRIDFNNAWEKYMGDDLTTKQDSLLRNKVMNTYEAFYNVSMLPVKPRRGEDVVASRVPKFTESRVFDIVATQKGRQIFAREIKTKAGVRLVDNRGRYAKRLP